MGKIHQRPMRKRSFITGSNRKKRPKTFKNEGAANKYAEKHKINKFILENLRSPESKTKKIRIKVLK